MFISPSQPPFWCNSKLIGRVALMSKEKQWKDRDVRTSGIKIQRVLINEEYELSRTHILYCVFMRYLHTCVWGVTYHFLFVCQDICEVIIRLTTVSFVEMWLTRLLLGVWEFVGLGDLPCYFSCCFICSWCVMNIKCSLVPWSEVRSGCTNVPAPNPYSKHQSALAGSRQLISSRRMRHLTRSSPSTQLGMYS